MISHFLWGIVERSELMLVIFVAIIQFCGLSFFDGMR